MGRTLLWHSFALVAALGLVSADVQFTSPKAGAKITGGSAVVVEWKDSGDSPAISDLTTYQLFLCAGGDTEDTYDTLYTMVTAGQFSITGNKATSTIGLGLGDDTTNAYFFKMISTAAKGGTVVNYSNRFTLTGMTGTFSDKVVKALKDVKGTDPPPSQDNTQDTDPADPAAEGDYGVEYTMQTGATRFAPMQPVPPTKITKKKATPLYPTSSVSIATTNLPIPKQQTTITQSQTFSVSSRENPASPAPMPSDDMAKFLARWKD
ncbi:hypothetical protein CC78DRAFT_472153 [Lojkania enalia]|uniref:Uncharacterized protein n=1 Tax=Lojkania enalia TaxID=147567 RepID=A0A9P4K2I1_9PLEO|nr:hypothetical protein CC78DRAFT_472153 [Didymosphaeria enalia]